MDRSLQVAFRALALSLTLPLLVFVVSELLPQAQSHGTEPPREPGISSQPEPSSVASHEADSNDTGPKTTVVASQRGTRVRHIGNLSPKPALGLGSQTEKVPQPSPLEMKPVDVKPVVVKPVEVRVHELRPLEVTPVRVKPVPVETVHVAPVPVETVHVAPVPVETVRVAPVQVAPVQVAPVEVAPVQVARVEVAQVQVAPLQVAPVQVSPIQVELRITGDAVLQSLMAGKPAATPEIQPLAEAPLKTLEEGLRRMETEQREKFTQLQQSQLAATQNQVQAEQLKLQQQALTQAEHDRKLDRLDQRVADLQSALQTPVLTMTGAATTTVVSVPASPAPPKTAEQPAKSAPAPTASSPPSGISTAAVNPGEDRRFSFVVHDVELTDCLAKLSELSGKNIVIRQPITGRVTASLHNVTVHQALATLLRPHGYALEVDRGNLYVISVAQRRPIARRPGRDAPRR